MLTDRQIFEMSCLELVREHSVVPDGCDHLDLERSGYITYVAGCWLLNFEGLNRLTVLHQLLRVG